MTTTHETNLRVLTPSRKKLRSGDVFAMLPPDGAYLFGRVIHADMAFPGAPMPGANLVYVYRHRSPDKSPDIDVLRPDDLLLSPQFINRMPWTRGYFETVATQPLKPGDLLERHCFRRSNGEFLDDEGIRMPGPVEPCGDWSLGSYRTIDDEISDALGIPRVPED